MFVRAYSLIINKVTLLKPGSHWTITNDNSLMIMFQGKRNAILKFFR